MHGIRLNSNIIHAKQIKKYIMTKRERYLGLQTDLEDEVWKRLDMTNCYYISNMGRVRSDSYIIKQQLNKKTGLLQAMVYTTEGKPKLLNVQSWVAKMFLPKPKDKAMIVRHISKDLLDNSANNLVWAYRGVAKNVNAGIYLKGIKKEKKPRYRYIIKQKTLTGFVVATYASFDELEKLGFKRSCIMAVNSGNYHKDNYKSYKWEVTKKRINYDE